MVQGLAQAPTQVWVVASQQGVVVASAPHCCCLKEEVWVVVRAQRLMVRWDGPGSLRLRHRNSARKAHFLEQQEPVAR